MTLFVFACIWVILASAVAFLPMRYQIVPGLALLFVAPVLIWLLGREFGLIPAALACLAFASMFRNPLRYVARRLLGQLKEPVE